jgi:lipopolysaccharide/colanic/teichoic acid biosynthesis glycosyltransferase
VKSGNTIEHCGDSELSSKTFPPGNPELARISGLHLAGKAARLQRLAPDADHRYQSGQENLAMACRVSPWCASRLKRLFDLACVAPALLLLSPLFAIIALAIRLTSPGPAIFRQVRAGRHRRPFTIYKFRTMVQNSEGLGPGHTAKGDPRITAIGDFLRRFKLDELPQLYNVLRGDMSLVGPRPKLPHHEHTAMKCRPGVTGAATLAFRDEQHILCQVPSEKIEEFYVDHVVPFKIQLDSEYMRSATFLSDIQILFATLFQGGHRLSHQDLLQGGIPMPYRELSTSRLMVEATGD